MKRITIFAITMAFLIIGFVASNIDLSFMRALAQTNEPVQIKMPEVIVLGKDAKLGQITFNHASHNGGKYSIDGTGPIACIECHHTAQPASDAAKHPPLKTAWPPDRTTVLTADLFAKDPKAAGVAACRDCHAKAGAIPKLIDKIPEIKHESSTALISMTNQQAFHRNCAGCHTEFAKVNKAAKGPTTMQCMMCHKKAA